MEPKDKTGDMFSGMGSVEAFKRLQAEQDEWKKICDQRHKVRRRMEDEYARRFAELFCCVTETWRENGEKPYVRTHIFGVIPEFPIFRCGGMKFVATGRTVVVNPSVEGGDSHEIRLCEGEQVLLRQRNNDPVEPETEYRISVYTSRAEALHAWEQLDARRREKA